MRRLIMLALLLAFAGAASAEIDWAGNAFPNDGAVITPNTDQSVYAQVYKGGVTNAAGQGAGITAELFYTTDIAPQVSVAMAYNTDIGNNDEYIGTIPQAALVGAAWVDVTVVFTDLTDGTTREIDGDQNGAPPPLRYTVTNDLPNDVNVTFTMCLSGTPTSDGACVIGSAAEIGSWGAGVGMTQIDTELYTVTVTFLAGGNPYFEYKYKKDSCQTWEDVDNRAVTLPTDGTTEVTLAPDSWNNQPIGCGLGDVLSEDKEICFQVCLAEVDHSGNVCISGSIAPLGNWGDGVVMSPLATELYQVCVIVPQGTPVPLPIEYKFRKDDCANWETVGNRLLTLDNASATSQTVTHTWDDGPGMCEPVATEAATWGSLKSLYR